MRKVGERRWAVPVAALVLTLTIGSAAFGAAGSASTDTSVTTASSAVSSTAGGSISTDEATTDEVKDVGGQRSDETLLTGTTAEQGEGCSPR